jgi:hypothetical protein
MEITEEKLVYVQEVTDKLLLEGIKEKIKAHCAKFPKVY